MTNHADHHDPAEVHERDLGLHHDVDALRRRGLGAAAALTACAADSSVEVAEGEIPEETAGPFPGDGSNGPNALTESGIVREDISSSFGSAAGVAAGVPLTLRFKVYDLSGDEVTSMPGAAVYAWHCDRDGNYSMYDGEAVDENYLRGVQEADGEGWLSFTTIFPGCYAGRWPHVHFEVYESVDTATSASNKLRTSQLAFPQDVCDEVYASEGYDESVANLAGQPRQRRHLQRRLLPPAGHGDRIG